MEKNPVINNIVDAFKVLDLINEKVELGITSIAKELNLPKSRVFRIVKSLEEVKAVKQNENTNYVLDYQLLKYANGINDNNQISSIAETYMKKAVTLTGESVNLGMQYGQSLLFLKRIHGDFYRLQAALAPIGDLYTSGAGKLFLSQWEDKQLQNYFNELPARTVNTVNTYDGFKNQQKRILETNISMDEEEYEYGLSCIAAPILDKNKTIIYAVSISGPTSRLKHKGIKFITNALQECAQSIQEELIDLDFQLNI